MSLRPRRGPARRRRGDDAAGADASGCRTRTSRPPGSTRRRYGLDAPRMRQLPEHAIVMHPGPMNRGMEIAPEVADSPRSTIVEQVANGVSVRMAVLYLLLGGKRMTVVPASRASRVLGGAPADLLHPRRGDRRRPGRRAGAEVIDADGLVALPGLVDLHTHLREPGREDAETVETGSRAAALGGYTAVCAMANTSPVADTAGVVEQVWRLGPRGRAGRRAADRRGHRRAGRRAAGRAGRDGRPPRRTVRIFSDDGHCVADPRLMRRALEYVKAFDGDHRPARRGAAAHRGRADARGRGVHPARPDRLAGGRRGGDHRPRRAARRARRQPPARLPRLHRRVASRCCARPRPAGYA